jgi:LuxR family quorum-sensing system transcriptional regulator CciR
MGFIRMYRSFRNRIESAANLDDLDLTLAEITRSIGCDYYALGHHVEQGEAKLALRLCNYPPSWVQFYDENHLSGRDPVHRAVGRTHEAFLWSDAGQYIDFSPIDQRHMELAQRHGLGEGFTVPAHMPGDIQASCSFAAVPGRKLDEDGLVLARLIADDAFKAARRLIGYREFMEQMRSAPLTRRQRECLAWVAAGKTDWEIGQIIGIREGSVRRHISGACARLGAVKRPQAVFLACRGGAISYHEVRCAR